MVQAQIGNLYPYAWYLAGESGVASNDYQNAARAYTQCRMYSAGCYADAGILLKRAAARVDGELHIANVVIPAGGEDKPDEERTWRQVLRDQSRIEAGME